MLRDAKLLHICYNLFLSISYFTSMRYAVYEQGVQTLLDCVRTYQNVLTSFLAQLIYK